MASSVTPLVAEVKGVEEEGEIAEVGPRSAEQNQC